MFFPSPMYCRLMLSGKLIDKCDDIVSSLKHSTLHDGVLLRCQIDFDIVVGGKIELLIGFDENNQYPNSLPFIMTILMVIVLMMSVLLLTQRFNLE
jgi:hypothetical protein